MPKSIDIGSVSISLYYLCWSMAIPIAFVIYHFFRKLFNFKFLKSTYYLMGDLLIGFLLGASGILGKGQIFVRVIPFLPLAILILSLVIKDDYLTAMDFLAPSIPLCHAVMHLGCLFEGCCHGYPADWGLYSNEVGYNCFPIQPIETLSSFTIMAILMIMAKKGKQKGKLYAWLGILFGGTRIIWEFFRDNEKIWHGMSEYSFFAIACLVEGIVLLFLLDRLKPKKESEKDSKNIMPLAILTLTGCCIIFVLLITSAKHTFTIGFGVALVVAAFIIWFLNKSDSDEKADYGNKATKKKYKYKKKN